MRTNLLFSLILFSFHASANFIFEDDKEGISSGTTLVSFPTPAISNAGGDSFSIGINVGGTLVGTNCVSSDYSYTIDSLCYANGTTSKTFYIDSDQLYTYLITTKGLTTLTSSTSTCFQVYDASAGHSSNSVALNIDCSTNPNTCGLATGQSPQTFVSSLSSNGYCSWVAIGSTGSTTGASGYTALAFDSLGKPYVAYQGSANNLNIIKYNNGAWASIGSNLSSGTASFISPALDSSNTLYVAYKDVGQSNNVCAKKYTGTWGTVAVGGGGSPRMSQSASNYASIAIDPYTTTPATQPYVAFVDGGSTPANKASIRTYDATNGLTYIGSRGLTSSTAAYTSIAFDSTGILYLAFQDGGNSSKTTVMSYNTAAVSPSWGTVGDAGFSAGTATYVSIAVDSSGTPYVVYNDAGNSNKATVMKCSSGTCTNWSTVGNAGFSAGTATYTSIAIDASGTPYVAYQDGGNSNKVTVMKCDSGTCVNWSTVGSAGFSAGTSTFTSIAINPSNNLPYVAYQDGANSNAVTIVGY